MFGVSGNPVIRLVGQSDFVTKIVLLILLFLSIVSWALFIYKLILSAAKQRQIKLALNALARATTFDEIRAIASNYADTLPGYFMARHLTILKSILETRQSYAAFSDRELELIEGDLQQATDEELYKEESYLPFLRQPLPFRRFLGFLVPFGG